MIPLTAHFRTWPACLAALALLVAWPTLVNAADACRIAGWSVDPAGLPVRAAASAAAPMLARLPPFVRDADGDYGPDFAIVESRDGWLRIADVGDGYRPPERPPRRLFAGTGWVEGRWVRTGSQSSTGHVEPSANAAVVVSLG